MKLSSAVLAASLILSGVLVGCGGMAGNSNPNPGSNQPPTGNPQQPGTGPGLKPYDGVHITTWHNDTARTGLNAKETVLTPSNVSVSNFGKLFSFHVDGHVYAQPLYVSSVPFETTIRNLLYVATEYDSIYAFDADEFNDGKPLWKTSLLKAGETPQPGGNPSPWIGITSTPVIDVPGKTLYAVGAFSSGERRLVALDIETGAIRGQTVIEAAVPSTLPDAVNGQLTLGDGCLNRAALLLSQGTIFIGFGGCAHGWLLSYDAGSLKQIAALSMSPNAVGYGKYPGGGGIWGSGAGPAADDQGNVYVVTGDGPNDQVTSWGDSVLKLNRNLQILDWFTPNDAAFLQCKDNDLGGAGVMLPPGTNQLVVGGKNAKMFVLNEASLGKQQLNDAGAASSNWFDPSQVYPFSCTDDQNNILTSDTAGYRIYGTAAWFNGAIFVGADPGPVRKFTRDANGNLTLASKGSTDFSAGTMGTTTFVTANGSTDGIVWAIDHTSPIGSASKASQPAVLHAYDALDLSHELWNSAQNAADTAGLAIKFTAPIAVNGKVYIGSGADASSGEIDVYGSLPHPR